MTTLYLFLGMLNKKIGNNLFRQYLISDNEYFQDDREPYLQYSIRESSLYFLSDLVCNFFISGSANNVASAEDIDKASWYFNEYHFDPSIQGMQNALKKMEAILDDKDEEWSANLGRFILHNLTFMYYDMENRKNGEETFVVINTTGEPLTATENLKPLIVKSENNAYYSRKDVNGGLHFVAEDWESIETWFWQKRCNGNDTADIGFKEFLRWVAILNADKDSIEKILKEGNYTFPIERISFEEIYKYWEIVKQLSDSEYLENTLLSPCANNEANNTKTIKQIDCFRILPLIAYCKRWQIQDVADRDLLRLARFLQNLTRIKNVTKAINSLVYDVIQIANTYQDIIEIVDNEKKIQISSSILTDEEKLKLQILRDSNKRNDIEEAFWSTQDDSDPAPQCHKIWSGEIMPLISWATKDGIFDVEQFKVYCDKFDSVFKENCDGNIDVVRRALLTRDLTAYPRIFKGYTNWSFCWEWEDWHRLIEDNLQKFKDFFDSLLAGQTCEDMIDSWSGNSQYKDFIKNSEILKYCEEKNIQFSDNKILLIKWKRTSGDHVELTQYLSQLEGE